MEPRDEIIDALIIAPEGQNPVLVLFVELSHHAGQMLTPDQLIFFEPKIKVALADGEEEKKKQDAAMGRLKETSPLPAPFVPLGF